MKQCEALGATSSAVELGHKVQIPELSVPAWRLLAVDYSGLAPHYIQTMPISRTAGLIVVSIASGPTEGTHALGEVQPDAFKGLLLVLAVSFCF